MTKRRRIKDYSHRKRFLGLSARDIVEKKKLQQQLYAVLANEDLLEEDFLPVVMYLRRKLRKLEIEPEYTLEKPMARRHRTISSYSESEIPEKFRFRNAQQLMDLKRLLLFPDVVVLDNGATMIGEEILLFGIRKLAFTGRFVDLIEEFGGEESVWTRGFKWFINHIFSEFSFLLLNGVSHFVPIFDQCCKSIERKLNTLGCIINNFDVFGFIDNTCFATCRPGGGPTTSGTQAQRHNPLIQQSFYTGWKHIHGIKIQTVTLPNGLIADVFGPVSVRHNDLYTLREIDINRRLYVLQNNTANYKVYGDSAYSTVECIRSSHTNVALTDQQKLENKCMSTVRESIEWINSDIKSKFTFVGYAKKMKLMGSDICPRIIIVACLLTNCYKCLNGCQTSEFFSLQAPELQEYLKKT